MSHHLLNFHYHHPRMTELKRVFWAHTVGSVGSSLVSIFVPIFLLKSGYSFVAVLGFLLAQSISAAVLQYPMAALVSRIGANRGLALGLLAAGGYFLSLLTLDQYHWPLVLVAAIWGADRSLYWLSLHADFSKSRAHEKSGSQISWLSSLATFAHGLTPAIGGVLATVAGINIVYVIAITLLVIAAAPLVRAQEVSRRRKLDVRKLDLKRIWRDPLANYFNGMTTVSEMVIWPLIIYYLVDSYAGVGVLSSLVIIASVTVAIYVGRREASHGEARYLHRGLWLESLTNILRLLAQTAGHVFGINLLNGVGRSLYVTPFMTRYYRHTDEEPRLEYIMLMELANPLGGATIFIIMLIAASTLSVSQTLLLGVALTIPASFGTRLIR